MQTLRQDAQTIIDRALADAMPDSAVRRALEHFHRPSGRLVLIAAGKAAWQMAKAAYDVLGTDVSCGAVITKYDHVKGAIGTLELFEAGHPVPDENSYRATARALELVSGLTENDTVLFLLSGGGSALFESPLIPAEEMADVTKQLLACGADIVEMNTIRKRLSAVKGGRFAVHCLPATVFSIVLSDIIGDPLDMIASGPACPDSCTCAQALAIVKKVRLQLVRARTGPFWRRKHRKPCRTWSPRHRQCPCTLRCGGGNGAGARLPPIRADGQPERCTAREAGRFLASVARITSPPSSLWPSLPGGETVVHLTGAGLGGRNQEMALAAAQESPVYGTTCRVLLRLRRNRRPDRCRRRLRRSGQPCRACRTGHFHSGRFAAERCLPRAEKM